METGKMNTFEEQKECAEMRQREWISAGSDLDRVRERLALDLAVEVRHANGLTPDAIKFHPDYKAARKRERFAFQALQDANWFLTKHFAKELRAERDSRRGAA